MLVTLMKKSIFFFIPIFYFSNSNSIPRVSIITSLFKGDEFITGFMDNITRQTMFKQCELIIINANSPGNEDEVIKPYLEQYPNIIYFRLEKDPGIYAVWNMAIKMARAEYITNANVDDRLAYNCYELHAQALDKHPEIDLVYSDFYKTFCPHETFYRHTGKPWIMPQFSRKNMYHCLPNNHPMWRKSMHKKYGFFDEKYQCSGDYEMWLRAVHNGAQFLKVNKILGLYYHNPQGLSTNPKNKIALRESRQLREKYKAMFR